MVTIVFLFFFLSQCYISILSIPDYIKKNGQKKIVLGKTVSLQNNDYIL